MTRGDVMRVRRGRKVRERGGAVRGGLLLAAAAALAVLTPTAATAQGSDTRLSYQALPGETGNVAIDSSSYANNGVMRGGLTRVDGYYQFHPVSQHPRHDRIVAPNSASLNPGLAAFTYRVRLKVSPTAEWENTQMAVIRHGDSSFPGGNYKLELRKNATTGVVSAECTIHDDDGHGVGYVQGHGLLPTIADGHWHSIACSRIDATTVSLSVDGHTVLRTTRHGDLGNVAGTAPLLIGFQFAADGVTKREQFVGKMDGIKLTVRS